MEVLPLLTPLVVFLATVELALAAFTLTNGDQRVLRQRLAGYSPTSGPSSIVPDREDGNRTILRERQFSRVGVVQAVLDRSSYADRLATELEGAAMPLRVGEYLFLRAACALVLMIPVAIFGVWWPLAIPLALIGFHVPKLYVGRRRQQRLVRFNDSLVDALTMMANALKSGSSFLQAVDLVGRELPPPLSEEFGRVVTEISIGTQVDDLLDHLSKRVPSYDLYLTVTAMQVQRQTGGNLAELLENISYTIRERIRLLRQVQVLTAQERMSAIVVGMLPVVALVGFSLLSPGYIQPFVNSQVGRILLGGAFAFQVVGFVVMNRLAKIDV
jgi:tight adherence protein B